MHQIEFLQHLRNSIAQVSRTATLLMTVAMVACTSEKQNTVEYPIVDEPLLINLTDVDSELAEYISLRYDLANEYLFSAAERGRLAMTYDANDFRESAITVYGQAHQLDPQEFTWPYFGALLEGALGNYRTAIDKVETALEIDTNYAAAWLSKGTWLLRLNQFEAAKEAFETAYEIDRSIHSVIGKAEVLLQMRNSQQALDLLEPLSDRVQHPHIYRMLARGYAELSRDDQAELARTLGTTQVSLVWQDPLLARREPHIHGFGGKLAKAQRYIQARRHEEALEILFALRDDYQSRPTLRSTLAWAYVAKGDTELAIHTLQIAIEEFPEHQPFYTQLGDLLSMSGNPGVALRLLEKSVELNDGDAEAHEKLGIVLMQLQNYDEAEVALRQALELGLEDRAVLHLRIGMIEGLRQNWDKAIEQFQHVIELEPLNPQGHIHLSLVYLESGQLDEFDQVLVTAEKYRIPQEEMEPVITYRERLLNSSTE